MRTFFNFFRYVLLVSTLFYFYVNFLTYRLWLYQICFTTMKTYVSALLAFFFSMCVVFYYSSIWLILVVASASALKWNDNDDDNDDDADDGDDDLSRSYVAQRTMCSTGTRQEFRTNFNKDIIFIRTPCVKVWSRFRKVVYLHKPC